MSAVRILVVAGALLAPAAPVLAGHPWTRPLLTVDVRPPQAYQGGRLPGARSIPLSSLTARRDELPAEGLVVLYGARGVEEARIAYRYLRSAGHANVVVLEGGFDAWQGQGFGVER